MNRCRGLKLGHADGLVPSLALGVEVVVDGLPLNGGVCRSQSTRWLTSTRSSHEGRWGVDGCRISEELVGPRAWARLVVMGVEVGGRWAPETRTFLSLLALAKTRCECRLLQRREEQACAQLRGRLRAHCWNSPGATGADGNTPQLHEVERDLASFLE